MSEKEIVRSTRGLKKRRVSGKKGLLKKLSICIASFICAISFITVGAVASLTNVSVDIDNDIYYYATAFNKDERGSFIIEDYSDLVTLSNLVNNDKIIPDTNGIKYAEASYVIVKDITAPNATTFTPIGTNSFPFMGHIYGNKWNNGNVGEYTGFGIKIDNVTISSSASGNMYVGLFGYIKGATIQNIGIEETCTVNAPNASYVAGLVGSAVSGTSHSLDNNSNTIIQNAGENLIENCYNYAPVTGSFNVGGIVGSINGKTTIKNCYNTGKITATGVTSGKANAGGIVGLVSGSTNVINGVYNIGEINATSASLANVATNSRTTGGIVGNPKTSASGLTISNAYYLNTSLVNEQGQNITIGSTGGLGVVRDIVHMSNIDALTGTNKMNNLASLKYHNMTTGEDLPAWIAQSDTNDKYFFPQLGVFNPTKYEVENNNAIPGFDYDWYHLPKNYAILYFPNGGTWRSDILEDTMNIEGTPGAGALSTPGNFTSNLTDHYNASVTYELFHNSTAKEDITRTGYVFAGWQECDQNGNFLTGNNTKINGAGFYTNDAGYEYGIKASSYGNVYVKANWVKVTQTKGPDKAITYGDNVTEQLQMNITVGNETGTGIVQEAGYHNVVYRWYSSATKTNTGGTLVATHTRARAGSALTSASYTNSDTIVPNDYLKINDGISGDSDYTPVGTYYFYCVVTYERVYDTDSETCPTDYPTYGTSGEDKRNNGSNEVLTSDVFTFRVNKKTLITPDPVWVVTKQTTNYRTQVKWTNHYNTPAVGDVNVQKYVVRLFDSAGGKIAEKNVEHCDTTANKTYSSVSAEHVKVNGNTSAYYIIDLTADIEANEAKASANKGTYYVTVELVPSQTNNAGEVNVGGGTGTTLKLYTVTYQLNNNLIKMYDDSGYSVENTIKRRYAVDGEGIQTYFHAVDGFLMPAGDSTNITIDGATYDALIIKNGATTLAGGTNYTYTRSAGSDTYQTKASLTIADNIDSGQITGPIVVSIMAPAHVLTVTGHAQVDKGTHSSTGGTIRLDGFYHKDNDGNADYSDHALNLLTNTDTSACPTTDECAKIISTYSVSNRNSGTDNKADNIMTFTATANDGYIFLGFFASQDATNPISAGTGVTVNVGTKLMSGSMTMTTQAYESTCPNGVYARFQANLVEVTVQLDDKAYNNGSTAIGSNHTLGVKLYQNGNAVYTLSLADASKGIYRASAIANGTYQIWTNGRQGDKVSMGYHYSGVNVTVQNDGSTYKNDDDSDAKATVKYYSLFILNGIVALQNVTNDAVVKGGFSSGSYLYNLMVIESHKSSTTGTVYVSATSNYTFRNWELATGSATIADKTQGAGTTSSTTTLTDFASTVTLYANFATEITLSYGFTSGNVLEVVANPASGYTYTYQWYVGGTTTAPSGGSSISGATNDEFALPCAYTANGAFQASGTSPNWKWLPTGTYYYYVVVTATGTGTNANSEGNEYIGSVQVNIEQNQMNAPTGMAWVTDGKTYAKATWTAPTGLVDGHPQVPTTGTGAVGIDHYVVRLFKDGVLFKTVTTTATEYEFGSSVAKHIDANGDGWISHDGECGTYTFDVQAIVSTTNNASNTNVIDSEISAKSANLYTVSYRLANVQEDNNKATAGTNVKYIKAGQGYSSAFTANPGYIMPTSISVTRRNSGQTSGHQANATHTYTIQTDPMKATLTLTTANITNCLYIEIDGNPNGVEIDIRWDGQGYDDALKSRVSSTSKLTVTLRQNGTVKYTLTYSNGKYIGSAIVNGTYDIWTDGRQGNIKTQLSAYDTNVNIVVLNNGSQGTNELYVGDSTTPVTVINYYSLYINRGSAGISPSISTITAKGGFTSGTYSYTSMVIENHVTSSTGTAYIQTASTDANYKFRTWGRTDGSTQNSPVTTGIATATNATTTISSFTKATTIFASFAREYSFYYGFTDSKVLGVAQSLTNGTASAYQWYLDTNTVPAGGSAITTNGTSSTYTLPTVYMNGTSFVALGTSPNLNWLPVGTHYFYVGVTTNIGVEHIGSVTVTITKSYLKNPENLYWDDGTTTSSVDHQVAIARWDPVLRLVTAVGGTTIVAEPRTGEPQATGAVAVASYTVILYKNGAVFKTHTGVTNTYFDFTNEIDIDGNGYISKTERGLFTFTVQAIASTTNNASKVNVGDSSVSDSTSQTNGKLYTVSYDLTDRDELSTTTVDTPDTVEANNSNRELTDNKNRFVADGHNFTAVITANTGFIVSGFRKLYNGTTVVATANYTYTLDSSNSYNVTKGTLSITSANISNYISFISYANVEIYGHAQVSIMTHSSTGGTNKIVGAYYNATGVYTSNSSTSACATTDAKILQTTKKGESFSFTATALSTHQFVAFFETQLDTSKLTTVASSISVDSTVATFTSDSTILGTDKYLAVCGDNDDANGIKCGLYARFIPKGPAIGHGQLSTNAHSTTFGDIKIDGTGFDANGVNTAVTSTSNCGTACASVVVDTSKNITFTATGTATGYTFIGFFPSQTSTTPCSQWSSGTTMTLTYAQYKAYIDADNSGNPKGIYARYITNANTKVTVSGQIALNGANANCGTVAIVGYKYNTTTGVREQATSATITNLVSPADTVASTAQKQIVLTATAKTGHTFVGWFSSTSNTTVLSTNNPYTVSNPNAGSSVTYVARFLPTEVKGFSQLSINDPPATGGLIPGYVKITAYQYDSSTYQIGSSDSTVSSSNGTTTFMSPADDNDSNITDANKKKIVFSLDLEKENPLFKFVGWFKSQTGTTENDLITTETTLTFSGYHEYISTAPNGVYARYITNEPIIGHSQVSTNDHSSTGGSITLKGNQYSTTNGAIVVTQHVAGPSNCDNNSCPVLSELIHPDDPQEKATENDAAAKQIIAVAAPNSGYTFVGFFATYNEQNKLVANGNLVEISPDGLTITFQDYDAFMVAVGYSGQIWARFIPTPPPNNIIGHAQIYRESHSSTGGKINLSAQYYDTTSGEFVSNESLSECEKTNGCATVIVYDSVTFTASNKLGYKFVGFFPSQTSLTPCEEWESGTVTMEMSYDDYMDYINADTSGNPKGIYARFVKDPPNEILGHGQILTNPHSSTGGTITLSAPLYTAVGGVGSNTSSTSDCPTQDKCAKLTGIAGQIVATANPKSGYTFVGFFKSQDATTSIAAVTGSVTYSNGNKTITFSSYSAFMTAVNNTGEIWARYKLNPNSLNLHTSLVTNKSSSSFEVLHSGDPGEASVNYPRVSATFDISQVTAGPTSCTTGCVGLTDVYPDGGITFTAVEYEGYKFVGWYPNLTNATITDESSKFRQLTLEYSSYSAFKADFSGATIYARYERGTIPGDSFIIEEVALVSGNVVKELDTVIDAVSSKTHYINITVTSTYTGAEVHSGDELYIGDTLTISYTSNLPFRSFPYAIYAYSGGHESGNKIMQSGAGAKYYNGSSWSAITVTASSYTYTYGTKLTVKAGDTYISVLNAERTFGMREIYSTSSTTKYGAIYSGAWNVNSSGTMSQGIRSDYGTTTTIDSYYDDEYIIPSQVTVTQNVASAKTGYGIYGWSISPGTARDRTHEASLNNYFNGIDNGSVILSGGNNTFYTTEGDFFPIWQRTVTLKYKDDSTLSTSAFTSIYTGAICACTGSISSISVSSSAYIWTETDDTITGEDIYIITTQRLGEYFQGISGGYIYYGAIVAASTLAETLTGFDYNSSTYTQTAPRTSAPSVTSTMTVTAENTNAYVCCYRCLYKAYYVNNTSNECKYAFNYDTSNWYYFYTLKTEWTVTATHASTFAPISAGRWTFWGWCAEATYGPASDRPSTAPSSTSSNATLKSIYTTVYACYKMTISFTIISSTYYGATNMVVDGTSKTSANITETLYLTAGYDRSGEHIEYSLLDALPQSVFFNWPSSLAYEPIFIGFGTSFTTTTVTYPYENGYPQENANTQICLFENVPSQTLYAKFSNAIVNNKADAESDGFIPSYLRYRDVILKNFKAKDSSGNYTKDVINKITIDNHLHSTSTEPAILFSNNPSSVEFEVAKLTTTFNYYLKISMTPGSASSAWIKMYYNNTQVTYGIAYNTYNQSTMTGSVSFVGDSNGTTHDFYIGVTGLNNSQVYKIEVGSSWYNQVRLSLSAPQNEYVYGADLTSLTYTTVNAYSSCSPTVEDLIFTGAPVTFDNATKQFTWVTPNTRQLTNSCYLHNMYFTLPSITGSYNYGSMEFNFTGSTFNSGSSITLYNPAGTTKTINSSTLSQYSSITAGQYRIMYNAGPSFADDKITFTIQWTYSSFAYGNVFADTEIVGKGSTLDLFAFMSNHNKTFYAWRYATDSTGSTKVNFDKGTANNNPLQYTFDSEEEVWDICYPDANGNATLNSIVYACFKEDKKTRLNFVAWDASYTNYYYGRYGSSQPGATLPSAWLGTSGLNATNYVLDDDPRVYNSSGSYQLYPVPVIQATHSTLVFVGWYTRPRVMTCNDNDFISGKIPVGIVQPDGLYGNYEGGVKRDVEGYTTADGWDATNNSVIDLFARYIELEKLYIYHNNGVQTFSQRTSGASAAILYQAYGIGYFNAIPSYAPTASSTYIGNISTITNVSSVGGSPIQRAGYTLNGVYTVQGDILFNGNGVLQDEDGTFNVSNNEILTALWGPNNTALTIKFSNQSNLGTATVITMQNDNDVYSKNGYSSTYDYPTDEPGGVVTAYSVNGRNDSLVYSSTIRSMEHRVKMTARYGAFTFVGWYSQQTGGVMVLNANSVTQGYAVDSELNIQYTNTSGKWALSSTNSTITLYPRFEATLEVTYRVQDGSSSTIGTIKGSYSTSTGWSSSLSATNATITTTQTTLATPADITLKLQAVPTGTHIFSYWEITYKENDQSKSIITYNNPYNSYSIQSNWTDIVVTAWFDDHNALVRMDDDGVVHKYFLTLGDAIDYANTYEKSSTSVITLNMLGNTDATKEGKTAFNIYRPMEIKSALSVRYAIGGTSVRFTFTIAKDTTNYWTGTWSTSSGYRVGLSNIVIYGKFVVGASTSLSILTSAFVDNNDCVITNSGTVSMSAGNLRNRGTGTGTSNATVYNLSTGVFTMNGGTIQSSAAYGALYNNGVANISAGNVYSTGSTCIIFNNLTLTISGSCVIKGGPSSDYAGKNGIYNNGTTTISGGTIKTSGTYGVRNLASATLNISAGTITASGKNGVYSSGTLKITGSPTISNTGRFTVQIKSGSFAIGETGTAANAKISGGTSATLWIEGGTTSLINNGSSGWIKNETSGGYGIYNSATITNIKTAKVTSYGAHAIYNSGSIGTIAGGTYKSGYKESTSSASTGAGISTLYHIGTGTIIISGSPSFYSAATGARSYTIRVGHGEEGVTNSKLTINGGIFYGGCSSDIIRNDGTLTINNSNAAVTIIAGSTNSPNISAANITSDSCIWNTSYAISCTIDSSYSTSRAIQIIGGKNAAIANRSVLTIDGAYTTIKGIANNTTYYTIENPASSGATLTINDTSTTGIYSAGGGRVTIYNGTGCTLTFNDGAIKSTNTYAIENNGTVEQYGSLSLASSSSGWVVNNKSGASYLLHDGIISGTGSSNQYAVLNAGTFQMGDLEDDVDPVITGDGCGAVKNQSSFTMSSGEMNVAGSPADCVLNTNTAVFYMQGGTIDGASATEVFQNDSKVESNVNDIVDENATSSSPATAKGLVMTGGTITATADAGDCIVYISDEAQFWFLGGTLSGYAETVVYNTGWIRIADGATIDGSDATKAVTLYNGSQFHYFGGGFTRGTEGSHITVQANDSGYYTNHIGLHVDSPGNYFSKEEPLYISRVGCTQGTNVGFGDSVEEALAWVNSGALYVYAGTNINNPYRVTRRGTVIHIDNTPEVSSGARVYETFRFVVYNETNYALRLYFTMNGTQRYFDFPKNEFRDYANFPSDRSRFINFRSHAENIHFQETQLIALSSITAASLTLTDTSGKTMFNFDYCIGAPELVEDDSSQNPRDLEEANWNPEGAFHFSKHDNVLEITETGMEARAYYNAYNADRALISGYTEDYIIYFWVKSS